MNELDLIKLNIFESYDNGEITYGEKCLLLERLETNILDKKSFDAKYTLYHASDKYIKNEIHPNSLNMGTRISPIRWSSYWCDNKDRAISFTIGSLYINKMMSHYTKMYEVLKDSGEDIPALNFNRYLKHFVDMDKCIVYIASDTLINVKTKEPFFDEVFKTQFKKYYNNNKLYLYTVKDVPIKNVGKGQVNMGEYTLDKSIKPDNVEVLSPDKILNYIKFVKSEDFEKCIKDCKMDIYGKKKSSLKEKIMYKNSRKQLKERRNLYNNISQNSHIANNYRNDNWNNYDIKKANKDLRKAKAKVFYYKYLNAYYIPIII